MGGTKIVTTFYIAGFGFRSSATYESLNNAYQKAAKDFAINALAGPADKCAHPALQALAKQLQLPLSEIDEDDLKGKVTPTNSEASFAARGTGSVAEACALIAAGANSHLCGKREISEDRLAVCAIAERR